MTTAKYGLESLPKLYFDGIEATIETLENEQVMDQLERSGIDIKNGKVRQVKEFVKERWFSNY